MNSKFNYLHIFLLSLILLSSFFIRAYGLTREDLGLAEAFRVAEADTLDGAFYKPLNFEEHPPLYVIFLFFWSLLGKSVFMLRLSSVLFGVGSILMIYFIGSKIFNYKVGLIASLILCFNPLHIDYSQRLEPYMFTVFFSFLSIYFLVKGLESDKFWHWFWFVIFIVIAGYSDYFILFLLVAITLSIIFTCKKYKSRIKSLVFSGIAMSILFIPNIFMGLFQFLSLLHSEKFAAILHPLWYILIIPYVLITLIVGKDSIFFGATHFPVKEMLFPLILIILFFGFLFLKGLLPLKEQKEKKTLLMLWFFIPIILLYLANFFIFIFIDPHRFLFISSPFFIIMARGMSSIKNKKIFNTFFILLLIIGSVLVYSHYQQHKPEIKPIASFIENNFKQGDVVAVLPQEYVPVLWYYLPKEIHATSFPNHFPIDTYTKFERVDFSIETIDEKSIPLFLEYQKELSRDYDRLWYVLDIERAKAGNDKDNFVLDYLSENYELILDKKSPDRKIGLYLFEI